MLRIHGRDAADGEAVSPVAVRHAVGSFENAGEGRHIGDLIEHTAVHPVENDRSGDNAGGYAHAVLIGGRNFPF